MASAVVNSTGDIFYSKVTDATGATDDVATSTPVNNVLITTTTAPVALVSVNAAGEWASDIANATTSQYTASASEAGPAKGTNLLKIVVATGLAAGDFIAKGYVNTNGTTLSNFDAITFYIRAAASAKTTLATGALSVVLYSDAAWTTAIETLTLPALPVCLNTFADTAADIDQWSRVVLRLNTPSTDVVKSIAIKAVTDPGVVDLYIHEFRLLTSFPGRTNFSISETVDSIDVSDYQSLTAKEFTSTYSTWTVSMDGHKEGAPPIAKGKEYVLGIWESDTVGQCFVGNASYTSFTPSGTFTETIKYNYSFQGTGFLARPLS